MTHHTFEKFVGGAALGMALLLTIGHPAHAEEAPTTASTRQQEIGINDPKHGTLLFTTQTQGRYINAPMVATDVNMDIAGPVIRTRLSQTFENTSNEWVEGIYVFPLPENAAVDHLRMVVGGRLIEGQIEEKHKARKVYEQARSEGKKASLIEQARPNIFTASVANIGPHETVAIQIEYQDKANFKAGAFSVSFPMSITPRYQPPLQNIQLPSDNPVHHMTAPATFSEPDSPLHLPVTIAINLDSGFNLNTVTSPYHDINVSRIDKDSAQIHLKEGAVPANKDFMLEWRAQPSTRPYSGVFRETIGDDTYVLTMLTPPETDLKIIQTHARESIFVIDTSGSMDGKSIVQARKALLLALEHLEAKDTFNIIRFASDHSSLFDTPRPAIQKNIANARQYIRKLEADGGTEMAPALTQALQTQNMEGERVRQVIFITDGAIGNEQQLFALVKDQLKTTRLFPVGIGSAPNSYFMSRAAKFGRGTYIQIGNLNEVQKRMGTLFAALDNPVLTNLHANIQSLGQSYPENIPDLYEGDPMVMIVKLDTKTLPARINLNGRLAGHDWAASIPAKEIQSAKGLSVLWARNKIAALEESRFDQEGANKIDAQILTTALKHHLVSRLTSLIAVDVTPSRPTEIPLTQSNIPLPLPDGWDFAKQSRSSQTRSMRVNPNRTATPAPKSLPLPGTASPHIGLGLLGLLWMMIGFGFLRMDTKRQIRAQVRTGE